MLTKESYLYWIETNKKWETLEVLMNGGPHNTINVFINTNGYMNKWPVNNILLSSLNN